MPVQHHAPPLAIGTDARWRVFLLGRLQAQHGDLTLTNFGSRSGAALLARLALLPQRSHAREELVELLWPGVAIDVGRNRLRQTLFTLRQLLEPPGPTAAPVLVADRFSVRVLPNAFDCDVLRFEELARAGHRAQAARVYAGELLPGFFDEWIHDERLRLSALFEETRPRPSLADTVDATPVADALVGRKTESAPSPAEPPAARVALPVYLTRFFGRDGEGARLRAEVLGHRLVTLLGPGGSGKTRLAVELAAALREPSAGVAQHSRGRIDPAFDFIAFVPLVSCATRAQVLDALLASLHLRQQEDDPLVTLRAALDGRRALLVLDNFEQLSGLAEDVVARLTMEVAGLHLLVTSRRVLGVDGEREIVIPPLALPRANLGLDEAAINPAVALFVDRARAVRADFHIGPSNLAAVVDVVQHLEGMPLAIELAAARVRSIAPVAMASLLRDARITSTGQALDLLNRSGPRSGGDPRHASMLRVIEWSWRLLDAEQGRLLAALTVFHGSFTAAAVQAVCGLDSAQASLQLDDLVANSLLRTDDVTVDVNAGATRYAHFEPVREYAALQLAPERARALRAAHLIWLATWAAQLPATPVLAEVRAEQPNLLAALRNALEDDAPAAAVRLMLSLRRVLEDVELPADGLASLAAAIDRCGDAALRGQGHTLLGPLLFMAGRSAEAVRHTALGLSAAPPGTASRARALHADARVRWRATRVDAGISAQLEETESLARAAADDELLASVFALRAFVANGRGDHADGERLHAEALALWEGLGNRHAANSGRYNLAACAQNAGRHAETLARLAVIEPDARALHDWRRLAQILNVRGNALSELRRWDEAAACFREGARLAWDTLALHELAYVLWNLPRALAHGRQAESAVLLAAFAETFWRTRFGRLSDSDRHDTRRVRRLAAVQLDATRVALLWERGAAMSLVDALALALRR